MAQKIKTDIEYMTWLTAILNLYGMYTDEINAISTVGFLTHALVDTNDAVIYKANQAIKESHVITAQKLDSLYKHAREVEIEPTFSIPAAMDMVLVISERNFEIEAMGNDQIKYYIINKSNIITVGNFVYSFDYDIEIRLEKGQNGEKYLTARYMTDGVNKNPISNLINPTIRAIREKKDNTYEYHLFVRLQQYSRELYEAEFGNRDFAVFNVGTKRATDEIACIDVFREHSSLNTSSEPIRLEKKMYFENSRTSVDSIYLHYDSFNKFKLIHKSQSDGFRPLEQDKITCDIYVTTGERGVFEYSILSGNSVKYHALDDSRLNIRVELIDGVSAGGKSYSINKEQLRKQIITKKSTRDSIVIENDLYMILNSRSTLSDYAVIKTRNDILKLFNIYTALKFKYDISTFTIPTNTLDLTWDLNTQTIESEPGVYQMTTKAAVSKKPIIGEIAEEAMINTFGPEYLKYYIPFIISYDKFNNNVRVYDAYVNEKYQTDYNLMYPNIKFSWICNWVKFTKTDYNSAYKITFELRTNLAGSIPKEPLVDIDAITNDITDTGFVDVYFILYDEKKNEVYRTKAEMIGFTLDEDKQDDYFTYNIDLIPNTVPTIISRDKMLIMNPSKGVDEWVNIEGLSGEIEVYMPVKTDPSTGLLAGDKELVNKYTWNSCALTNNRSASHKVQHNVLNDHTIKLFNFPVVEYTFYKDHYEIFRKAMKNEYDSISYIEKYQGEFSYSIKFMNTYGYSATYTIGFDKGLLNNVTVDMVFTAVRKLGSTITEDELSKAVYEYISSINFIKLDIFHMSNLYAYIKTLYPNDIELIQFRGLNGITETEQLITMNISEMSNKTVVEKLSLPLLFNPDTQSFKYKVTWQWE